MMMIGIIRRSLCLLLLVAARSSSWAFVPSAAQVTPQQRQWSVSLLSHTKRAVAVPNHHHRRSSNSNRGGIQARTYFQTHRGSSSRSSSIIQMNAAANSPSFAAPGKKDVQAVVSAAVFVAIDVAMRRLFRATGVAFPSSLAACSVLFAALLVLPSKTADGIFDQLQPGAALLAKYLPVFFVPSLVSLPLADNVGSAVELLKVGSVVVGGFFFTLLTTAFSVTAVRKLKGSGKTDTSAAVAASDLVGAVADSIPAKKVFSDEWFNFLCLSTAVTGVRAVSAVTNKGPWTSLFLLSATLNSFVFGARLPAKFKQLVHPLVTCTSLTWTAMAALCALTHRSFRGMLKSYTAGSSGLHHHGLGAGDVLLFLLGPAVVSLAISMYEKRKLMRENLAELGTAIAVSTAGGLYGTALAVRFLEIASPYLRLALLSRNITSPLAMAIAGILGADVALAVSMVVVTGLIGANFGAAILDACGIKDAVARGLGIGAAAHGLGTAAFSNEKDAFPFAAISMALTATAATVTVSIPYFRRSLVQLALGV